MKLLVNKPIIPALFAFALILGLSFVLSVPVIDATSTFKSGLVNFTMDSKITLPNLLGMHLIDLKTNGLLPNSIVVKPVGWAMVVVIYFGLPLLVYLRFRFTKNKLVLQDGEENNA